MSMMVGSTMWPEPPEGLMKKNVKLHSSFRSVALNHNISNEELGRITRCLVLDTDVFLTPRIEPTVFAQRDKLAIWEDIRRRVAKSRKLTKDNPGRARLKPGRKKKTENAENATSEAEVASLGLEPHSISGTQETPLKATQETPPIVPLEKPLESPLEKTPVGIPALKPARRGRSGVPRAMRQDLFSFAATEVSVSEPSDGAAQTESTQSAEISPQEALQDAGQVNTWVGQGSDSRADLAWIPQRFEMFWRRYPRKVAKSEAVKAFAKIAKRQSNVDAFMSLLLSSLDWWKTQDSWAKDGGKFVPYPATWLNGGHWADYNDNGSEGDPRGSFLRGDAESDDELIRRMQGG